MEVSPKLERLCDTTIQPKGFSVSRGVAIPILDLRGGFVISLLVFNLTTTFDLNHFLIW
jgi:uncharacterized protein YcgI (DUF1989 family)